MTPSVKLHVQACDALLHQVSACSSVPQTLPQSYLDLRAVVSSKRWGSRIAPKQLRKSVQFAVTSRLCTILVTLQADIDALLMYLPRFC